ncbi:PQQ-dependent sugar dehydrogenase [Maribacter sp. 2307ULW6-5]|uniref:PQQ-dependent sugar dehydrogenase n=1 Tax=Maribacter sp. 2307ULW6-5 TaxID=3386275 RepID=UPI0039BD2ACE
MLLIISCASEDRNETELPDPDVEQELLLVNAFPNAALDQPLDLQVANGDSGFVYVVEKKGRIVKLPANGEGTGTDFLTLGGISTSSEQGLLGLAFHPNYSSNGHFFVFYTPNRTMARVSKFTVSGTPAVADVASEEVILEIPQPFTNHNGGQIAFGPDGYLYIATGDGGDSGDPQNNAQNRGNLLGNILRLDVDNKANGANYAIPEDNPFLDEANVRPEIYAYGFRNPWRMSFDARTGTLWTADVGQGEREEINVVAKGGNYGWKILEGTSCFSGDCEVGGLTPPVFEYGHDSGDRSITGGFVYRGTALPSLMGNYVYGDFVSGRVWAFDPETKDNELLLESRLSLASFGTDAENELYLCDLGGNVFKMVASPD